MDGLPRSFQYIGKTAKPASEGPMTASSATAAAKRHSLYSSARSFVRFRVAPAAGIAVLAAALAAIAGPAQSGDTTGVTPTDSRALAAARPEAHHTSALPIDSDRSSITIHVAKTGLFSAFADNHVVSAPIASGYVDSTNRKVSFQVQAARMRVLDPTMPADRRSQVQANMIGREVLDAVRYPEISFESTRVKESGSGWMEVAGILSLHGVARAVAVNVKPVAGCYAGNAKIRQTAFGITPISLAGGTVKVKDELHIDFNVCTRR
jgi:polyisoprenoid-binding protein YceI